MRSLGIKWPESPRSLRPSEAAAEAAHRVHPELWEQASSALTAAIPMDSPYRGCKLTRTLCRHRCSGTSGKSRPRWLVGTAGPCSCCQVGCTIVHAANMDYPPTRWPESPRIVARNQARPKPTPGPSSAWSTGRPTPRSRCAPTPTATSRCGRAGHRCCPAGLPRGTEGPGAPRMVSVPWGHTRTHTHYTHTHTHTHTPGRLDDSPLETVCRGTWDPLNPCSFYHNLTRLSPQNLHRIVPQL